VVGAIIGAIVFATVGGILGLSFIDSSDILTQRIWRIIMCGGFIGAFVGGVVGYYVSQAAQIAYCALSIKPIPVNMFVNMILLGQFLETVSKPL
jgi:hypothetical protein